VRFRVVNPGAKIYLSLHIFKGRVGIKCRDISSDIGLCFLLRGRVTARLVTA